MSPAQEYVVKEGDTLSAIALEHYGDGTEPSWQKIYAANADVIGDDPDVLMPGQKLTIPPNR